MSQCADAFMSIFGYKRVEDKMTDRELLESAAKAYRYHGKESSFRLHEGHVWVVCRPGENRPPTADRWERIWDPRTNDGDCARLEAALQLHVFWRPELEMVEVGVAEFSCGEPYGTDRQTARRLASTRAAAEIGKNIP